MSKNRYADFIIAAENTDEYWAQTSIIDFTEEVLRLMEIRGLTKSDLAKRLNMSPAYITKVLRGNVNFTLLTMTKLARALGAVVRIHLAPDGVVVFWQDQHVTGHADGYETVPADSQAPAMVGESAL